MTVSNAKRTSMASNGNGGSWYNAVVIVIGSFWSVCDSPIKPLCVVWRKCLNLMKWNTPARIYLDPLSTHARPELHRVGVLLGAWRHWRSGWSTGIHVIITRPCHVTCANGNIVDTHQSNIVYKDNNYEGIVIFVARSATCWCSGSSGTLATRQYDDCCVDITWPPSCLNGSIITRTGYVSKIAILVEWLLIWCLAIWRSAIVEQMLI